MQLDIFQVDTFCNQVFKGNPAAVCPLEHWLEDDVMLNIAMENALAETAFFVPDEQGFHIRWFTPEIEMDLCGHATLAAAHVIVRHLGYEKPRIQFSSNSGPLTVDVEQSLIHLDFPARKPVQATAPASVLEAFNLTPIETLKSRDVILVLATEKEVRQAQPTLSILNQINLDPGGVIVTAQGEQADFVSRFFTPQATIPEDPVTGSAHCSLIPYWAERLAKDTLTAQQLSAREGTLFCQHQGQRVRISGEAVTYMVGKITL